MQPNASSKADEYHERGYDLHRRGLIQEAAAHYREAVRLQPDHARAWSNLGLTHIALGEYGEAERCQREALLLEPDFADAHNNLGLLHYQLGRVAEAENCFRSSLRLRPGHPNAHLNLAIAEHSLGRLDAAEDGYHDALAAGANLTGTNSNLSVLLREMGRVPEAEGRARAALEIDAAFPAARINLALALLLTGRWAEAWPHYEARWQTGDLASERRDFAQPQWTGGQPLKGRTILLHAEQGLGDTLQFCRYAPMVAEHGARVVLEVQPSLVRLLSGLAGVDRVLAKGDPLPPFDLHCPLMSLPMAFGTTPDTVPMPYPYLAADPDGASLWRERLAPLAGRRIGLVWAGSSRAWLPHAAAIDRRRSMRLADMAPLADVAGCSFVSLQLGRPAAQLASPPRGLAVHDFAAELYDFAETAALVANLDLVVSVDTAVAHLAAALGRPVWLLNRFDSCWRWLLDRNDSPWYMSLTQFRNTGAGDWSHVMHQVRDALAEFARR
jgi:Flp pilus assembly protein TadD